MAKLFHNAPAQCLHRFRYTLLVVGAFAALAVGPLLGLAPPSRWWGLPILSIPLAVPLVSGIWKLDGRDLNPLLGGTAKFQLLFCALFTGSRLMVGSGEGR